MARPNPFELHPDRLTTSDAQGRRIFVYPADVRGLFRRRRDWVQLGLVIFFLALPWCRWKGQQALLFDIGNRHFEFFGLSLRAHNVPLLFLVLSALAFGLFFFTAVFGRVWCGWACPQTVFIDGVFRRIERWVEGPAHQRRIMDGSPWNFEKVLRKSSKWLLFVLSALVIVHSFLAYFIGTGRLGEMMSQPPSENGSVFLAMSALTALILFNFAWFREQFCTIVCPYGRLQSVLLDKTSLVVAYDAIRGEPRRNPEMRGLIQSGEMRAGDCVNCYRCVQVCPTGIDIRRGLQMECIACTSCIDACNEVMAKTKRPPGLIRYDSLETTGSRKWRITVRSALYLSVCVVSLLSLAIFIHVLDPLSVEFRRASDSPYSTQTLDDGRIVVLNHFKMEVSNQSNVGRELSFTIGEEERKGIQVILAKTPLSVDPGQILQVDIFLRFPKTLLKSGQYSLKVHVLESEGANSHPAERVKEVVLVGPFT